MQYVAEADGGGGGDAAASTGAIGSAVVTNGGEPSDFKYSHAFYGVVSSNNAVLLLFISDRPRTCTEHLAGVDYVGAHDIFFPVDWPKGDGPARGTWHFTGSGFHASPPPGTPRLEAAWFLEHDKCGEPGKPRGQTLSTNEVNYLTLTEVGPSRVTGKFITQMNIDGADSEPAHAMYLEGSFDTVPCLLSPSLSSGAIDATLPSTTCK